MQSDQEIFDAIGVPEERRPGLQRYLHAWARSAYPGPNTYAFMAVLANRMIELGQMTIPEPVFDLSEWMELLP